MSANQRPSMFRRKILIYPKFQLSLVAVNVVTMIAVLGAIEYQILSSIQEVSSGQDNTLSPKFLYNRFIEYQMSVLYSGLALYLVIAFVVSCFVTLIISHRLAGPMVRMQKYFKQMEESGKIEQPLKFRDGDFLKELPEAVNRGLDSIQKSQNQNNSAKSN